MSKSQCPFPNQFHLTYLQQLYQGGNRYTVKEIPCIAVKDNGWYRVYPESEMNKPVWRRLCYEPPMRWYTLEEKIYRGVYYYQGYSTQEADVDISELI